MDRNRQRPAGTLLISIAHQPDKHERQKQRGQKIKGAVLIAGNTEVGAGLLARHLQVNLRMTGDLPDIAVLEHLESGPKANDDTAPDILARLLEDTVG